MRVTTAFNRLLRLPGASVIDVCFTGDGIVVTVRLRRRRRVCSRCGQTGRHLEIHDRRLKRWRHLDLGATRCVIECELRLLRCLTCGVRMEPVPWARPGAHHTRDFEDLVAWLAQQMAASPICRLLRIGWDTSRRRSSRWSAAAYDADGNLTQRVDSGANPFGLDAGTTTYSYDDLGRLIYSDYPGSAYDSEKYDLAGNLVSIKDANGTTYYEYDDLNRLKKLLESGVSTNNDASKVIYTWEESSTKNDLTIKYPTSPEVRNQIAYDKAGRMLSTCVWQYSSDACAAATPLLKLTYDYQQSGSSRAVVQSVTDKNGAITRYCYDDLSRLVRAEVATAMSDLACGPDPDQSDWFSYRYDQAGNVLTRERKSTTTETFAYNANNQLCWKYDGTSANGCGTAPSGASTYTFDSDGNETAGPTRTAQSYNDRGQLGSMTIGGSATTRGVRGPGQAELTTIGSAALTYTPLGLASYGSDRYIRDDAGGLVSQVVGGTRQYFIADHLGSTRGLLSTAGTLAKSFAYDPYGRDIGTDTIGSSTTRMGYASGMVDQGGLYHYGARYYDPAELRWTQADPLNQPSDLRQANRYGYVAGNPANYTDPTGTDIFEDAWNGLRRVADRVVNNPVTHAVSRCVTGAGLGFQRSGPLPGLGKAAAAVRGCYKGIRYDFGW